MEIFEFEDYKKYVKSRILSMPKRGYGQLRRLSEYLGVNTAFISQVFKGDKNLSSEQAIKTALFFGLNELETEYFISLTQLERAGSQELKRFLKKQIAVIKEKSQRVSNRLKVERVLAESDKAIFYSDWYYSAIRQLPAIKGFDNVDAIANYVGLSRAAVNEIIHFLLQNNLLNEEKGKLTIGPSRTHLEPESPWVKMHHTNWRTKALENLKDQDPTKLHFSFPTTLSIADAEKVRARILKLIEDIGKIVDPSPSEELRCLNIDWFKV